MHDRHPMFRRLLELLREEGLAGTTVLKGMAGFGHDRHIHTVDLEVAALGLPIVLEVVDTPERIDRVLPKLDAVMAGGIITTERAHVIRYAGATSPPADV
jgi:PII-like signaling protein